MACRMAPSGVARCGCPLSPQLSSEKIPIVARKELEHLDTFVGDQCYQSMKFLTNLNKSGRTVHANGITTFHLQKFKIIRRLKFFFLTI